MIEEPIAGRVADLVAGKSTGPAGSDTWVQAAEDCVLARLPSLRLVGGLPRRTVPLRRETRIEALRTLLGFWADGCTSVVDEDLFADIVMRNRTAGMR